MCYLYQLLQLKNPKTGTTLSSSGQIQPQKIWENSKAGAVFSHIMPKIDFYDRQYAFLSDFYYYI